MMSWPPPWPWMFCLSIIFVVVLSCTVFLVLVEARHSIARKDEDEDEVQPGKKKFDMKFLILRVDCSFFIGRLTPESLPSAVLYRQELWQACYGMLHPAWLLAHRVFFLIYFVAIMAVDLREFQWRAYSWFTQWNFTMLIIYFAIGVSFSLQACMSLPTRTAPTDSPSEDVELLEIEADRMEAALDHHHLIPGQGSSGIKVKIPVGAEAPYRLLGISEKGVGFLGYTMQAFYQVSLPLALVVDSVFWIVLFPAAIRYHIEKDQLTLVRLSQHALNLVAVTGEFALNSMRFPCFRSAYMLLWVSAYVLSQWVGHDGFQGRWAYDFLANDTAVAPLWYVGLLLYHLFCYQGWVTLHRLKAWFFPVSPTWGSGLVGFQQPKVFVISNDSDDDF